MDAKESPTAWTCPIEIVPLREERGIHGEGSLQPLCLALRMIQTELAIFLYEGLLTLEDGAEFPLRSYLPPGWI
jgi:hypothetical protein